MKYSILNPLLYLPTVALYTSAWIEIIAIAQILIIKPVALYTSAWIEISRVEAH